MLQLSSKVLSIRTKNHSIKRFIEQVCIQLPTSADNVTLPAFAAVGHVVHISCPQGPQLQTHRGGWTMGQTDRRTPEQCQQLVKGAVAMMDKNMTCLVHFCYKAPSIKQNIY